MPAARPDDLVGTTVDGRYAVLERLAEGGMASVYLATDTRLDREVALKIMRPHLAHDEVFVSRFRREARSAARLSHPGIVAVHDQGESDGVIFLAMEYVPGRTLREVIDTEGPLTPRAALDILEPMLDALAAAHRTGIVHRDVKPENVLLRDDGVVKVADFGLARAVTSQTVTGTTGLVLGTVSYMSPEQVERSIADARSDVYAAGLVLFEMLTGRKAVDGEVPVNVLFQHVRGELPLPSALDPGIPEPLDDLVATATARDPDDRPADAAAFLHLVRETRAELSAAELDTRPGPVATAAVPLSSTRAMSRTGVRDEIDDLRRVRHDTDELARSADPDPVGPPRRRWPWVLLLLALAGAAAAWFFLLGPGAIEKVPAGLVGMGRDAASARIESAHLSPAVQERFDERVATGTVVSTRPLAGEPLRRGSEVTLVVSKGKERYAVPDLSGATQQDAADRLTRVNLAVGTVTRAWSEKVPVGEVVSSSPAAGAPLKRGTLVDLVLSRGRRPIMVPDLTGTSADAAVARLETLGLRVDATKHKHDDTVAKGLVLSQDPSSGRLYKGDRVTIVVSDGPVLVKVPSVVGMQVDRARSRLEAAGFRVRVRGLFGGIFGTVRFQSPGAGQMAPRGITVTLQTV